MFLIKTTLPISYREFEVTSFAQSIVESGAACVQHREISSTYSWDGKLNHDKEWLLEIKVSEKNKAANAFYDCFNFKTVGKRKKYYNNEDDALLKEKILKK